MIPGKQHPHLWFSFIALFAMSGFWLLRLRHLRWGDAAILVAGLSAPEPVIYNWQAPFTVFLHQRLWTWLFKPWLGWGVGQVYALVSIICGGLSVFVLCQLAYALGRTLTERSLILGSGLTCGSMQLFCGYVENYTIITLGILILAWVGLRVLQGQNALWVASVTLALTNAFHPSTIVLWPALLYLAWQQGWKHGFRRQSREQDHITIYLDHLLQLIMPPLIIATTVLTLMELGEHGLILFLGDDRPGGGDHIWFVPLFELTTAYQYYTMFSWLHLLDWLNLQFLLSAFGLPLLGFLFMGSQNDKKKKSFKEEETSPDTPMPVFPPPSYFTFLTLASLAYLLFTWVWNADYGLRKDWDLFSPPAFLYTLLAALWLCRSIQSPSRLGQATLIIIAVSALHTGVWIYANTLGG